MKFPDDIVKRVAVASGADTYEEAEAVLDALTRDDLVRALEGTPWLTNMIAEQRQFARDAALEDAAILCTNHAYLSERIRALKSKPEAG